MVSRVNCQGSFNKGRYSDLLELSDGRIVTDGGCSFNVHKVILASSSGYFRAMFCGMDKDKSEYRISNIDDTILSEILSYIYTNDICVTEMNLNDLLLAADYFVLKDLYLKLKEAVKTTLTDANCLKLYFAAYQLNENEMFQQCLIHVQRRFNKIMIRQKEDLVDLPQELLKNILSDRNLNVESEQVVWQAIIYWIQADFESRLTNVPSLLLNLAVDEIDENLAAEIINHDIVLNNSHIEIESLHDLGNKSALKNLLLNYSNSFRLQNFRIPRKLNIISKYIRGEEICEIYISYDETHDLWRKIADFDFDPEYLIAIGWNVFIFEQGGPKFSVFKLRTMEWKIMQNLNYFDRTVFVNDHCIYIVSGQNEACYIDVYEVAIDMWFRYRPIYDTDYFRVAAIKKNIFIVGAGKYEMKAVMFNSVTKKCKDLAKPNIIRHGFDLVAYRGKIYLVSGIKKCIGFVETISHVEVFDCAQNIWNVLPDLPFTYEYMYVIILNDEMIVFDAIETDKSVPVKWDDLGECWKIPQKSNLPKYLHHLLRKNHSHSERLRYKICSVDDTETIKFLTQENRNPKVKMEKFPP